MNRYEHTHTCKSTTPTALRSGPFPVPHAQFWFAVAKWMYVCVCMNPSVHGSESVAQNQRACQPGEHRCGQPHPTPPSSSGRQSDPPHRLARGTGESLRAIRPVPHTGSGIRSRIIFFFLCQFRTLRHIMSKLGVAQWFLFRPFCGCDS